MRAHRRRNALLLTAVACCALLLHTISDAHGGEGQSERRRTVWEGIYTAEQATRGQAVYTASCRACHLADLIGSATQAAPPLAGELFIQDWLEDTVGNLFSQVRLMPFDQPGSLSDQALLDTLAYILQYNEFPAGETELTADGLDDIWIEGPDGPGPVPSSALVRVVGCLTRENRSWMLTHATEPVRTRDPGSSAPDERSTLVTIEPGPHTFELLNVYPSPDDHEGHRMEIKGLLIRLTEPERINVSSVAVVAPICPAE